MSRIHISKKKLLLTPFFSLAFISILYLLGTSNYLKDFISLGDNKYDDNLSFVAIAKNEGPRVD